MKKEKPLNVEKFIIPYTSMDSAIIAPRRKQLEKTFDHLQRLTGFNGVVLYAEKGRVVFEKAYGYENVRRRRHPLKLNDDFQLASGSKMFSALAIMILKHQGKVSYDVDIRKYLPGFPYEGITLRMLMHHRSGIPRYMSLAQKYWKDKKVPLTNNDMLELFEKYKPHPYFKPDQGFDYCNSNYALLANVVEVVTGEHFEDFIKQEIFEPLRMDSSFVYTMRNHKEVPLYVDKGVPGYYRRGWRWREMTNDYLNGVLGDKNIYASVRDLYRFDRSWDEFTLLPDSVLREAFVPGSPHYWRRNDNYGFGWRIRGDMDSTVYHFGWWKGFRSFNIRDMKHHKTLIVLTNTDRGPGSASFWHIIQSDTLPLGNAQPINPNRPLKTRK
ncbi:MAG: beta-lactamase family protein [Bacteroidales bacterium]|nr:beta-lactamase family protein [Bacteroidales bacterium]